MKESKESWKVLVPVAQRPTRKMNQIDLDNVGQWATERKLAYTNFRSLARPPEVRDLVSAEVDRANGLALVH